MRIEPSRRSFLTGLGAVLITAPAIVRAGSIMPVKQMLILPPKLADILPDITGFARQSPEPAQYYSHDKLAEMGWHQEELAKWNAKRWEGKQVMSDADERWERLKARAIIKPRLVG